MKWIRFYSMRVFDFNFFFRRFDHALMILHVKIHPLSLFLSLRSRGKEDSALSFLWNAHCAIGRRRRLILAEGHRYHFITTSTLFSLTG
jgi:hypothetical protein